MSRTRLSILGFVLLCAVSGAARADALFQAVNPPLRTSWSYLRTQNIDLALIELDGILAKLPADANAGVKDSVSKALKLAEAGEIEKAGDALFEIRQDLRKRNKTLNETLFEDCIWDANRLGDVLWPTIRTAPDFKNEGVRTTLTVALMNYRASLQSCNDSAPIAVQDNAEFRRLMDGTLPSLDIAIEATQKADNALFYRYMIEIISFDRLLYFRFG